MATFSGELSVGGAACCNTCKRRLRPLNLLIVVVDCPSFQQEEEEEEESPLLLLNPCTPAAAKLQG
jgi:hypothetical protein